MKILCVLILFVLVGCSIDFERDYYQIDGDMVRPISYIFTNPETAPGDTAELKIFFAGKRISLDDISWRVSWNIYIDDYGNMAPRGESALKLIGAPIMTDEFNGQSITVKFQVPADILHKAEVLPNDLSGVIKNHQIGDISQKIPFTKKADILAFLEDLAKNPEEQKTIPFQYGAYINGLAQMFSARYEIYMDFAGETPRTKLRNTARWHGKLKDIKGFFVNKNPKFNSANSVKIWEMNGSDASKFDKSQSREIAQSGDTLNIPVNSNKTIFMEVFASKKDSVLTLEQAMTSQSVNIEDYYLTWFCDSKNLRNSSYINSSTPIGFDKDGYGVEKIYTDDAKAGDTGFIWCFLYDQRLGVSNHPEGRDFAGFPVKFVE